MRLPSAYSHQNKSSLQIVLLYRPASSLHRLCPARKRGSNSEAGWRWGRHGNETRGGGGGGGREAGVGKGVLLYLAVGRRHNVKLLKTRRSWKSAMVRNYDKSHNFRLPRVHVLFASIQKLSSAPSCCYSNHIYSCCSTFITEPKPESVSQHCWSLIYRVLSVINYRRPKADQ